MSPFFFLAMFPSYLKKLPKSGGWLVRVKVVMAFFVFASAYWAMLPLIARDLLGGGGITYGTVVYTRGDLKLDAGLKASDVSSRQDTRGSFNKLNLDVARVQALLRRVYAEPLPTEQVWGRYKFMPIGRRLEIDGKAVSLTQKEFDIALFLFRNKGRLLSRRHLLESLWGSSNPPGTELMSRSLDTHISRIRSVLNLRPENGYRLSAVYGQGYRLESIGNEDYEADAQLAQAQS